MEEYRIPKLEEFIQGFEFELAKDYSFGIMDFSNSELHEPFEHKRFWNPMKVWWKYDSSERIVEKDENGITWDISGATVNFFKPFDEKSFIEQGLVRVKI